MWLSGWSYRKKVTLSRASGAVTNYQMKLLVGESSGATGENVDCGGKVSADFKDLRFTTSDGSTLLDYWIESISGATPNYLATVWIEFNSIGTGATTFYMYYGNSGASSASNGANTFIVFDDFAGDAINTDNWTVVQGDVGVGSGVLTLSGTTGTRGLIEHKTGISQGAAWYAKFKTAANKLAGNHISFRQTGDWNNRAADYYGDAAHANQCFFSNHSGGGSTVTSLIAITGADYYDLWRGTWEANKSTLMKGSNTLATHTTNVPTGTQYLTMFETLADGVNLLVDYVFVVKYSSTEPAWGAWGIAESGDGGLFTFHG